MEIEKKYSIKIMPEHLEHYESKVIEQGYLCSNPVVRIRKSNEDYILTYKSKFGILDNPDTSTIVSNEVEVPLNEEGYLHLKEKIDNHLIYKVRYLIPLDNGRVAELDVFQGRLKGLIFVEVEFQDEATAESFQPPQWFGEDISSDRRFGNSSLSKVDRLEDLYITEE